MDFKNGSKNIQAAGYHGVRTVTLMISNISTKDLKTTKQQRQDYKARPPGLTEA